MKKESKKRKKYIKKSFIFFKDVKGKIIILTLLYIIICGAGFLIPIIEAQLITSITDTVVNKVLYFALGLFILKIIEDGLWYVAFCFWQKKVRIKILFNIRKYLVDNILELQISNFDKFPTGFFQERVKQDPYTVARIVNAGQRYILDIITKVGVIIYIMCINWLLGLIYIAGVVIVTIIDIHCQEISKEKNKELRRTDEEVNSILSEIIRGVRDIKLLNFKPSIKMIALDKLGDANQKQIDKDIYDNRRNKYEDLVLLITVFLIIAVGIKFVGLGLITTANLIVLYLYHNQVFSLMWSVSDLRSALKEYELAVERIFDLSDKELHPQDEFGKVHIDNFKGKIEFDNVSFGYIENKKVLDGLSFIIEPKDTVALVGSSGSGKTTIFNLLAKSYLVNSGEIKLDGVNINDLDEDTLRRNISIITQNPYIFNMSIKDNLRLVKPKATIKELDEVCKEACFYDYVMSLPNKYNTIIGEGGVTLSGGQRQRLAIARALLKDCKILLFDEATSALDNITQKEIQESIEHISKDYTIIIVAHRLSTIINTNGIYFLEDGKINDFGTHKELLKRNKKYKELYETEARK